MGRHFSEEQRKDPTRTAVRIGLVGCGQICEAHLREICLISGAELVGVCDLSEPLALDLAERFNVPRAFCNYEKMVEEVKPDVVHITTPPHTHVRIGTDVMRKRCHTYIEKPFGMSYQEANEIIETAKANRVIACAGFSQLYDVVSRKLKTFVTDGQLGEVVHIETYYGNSLDGSFSRLFLHEKDHWIHRLPGKLFQNIISHALYHVVPLLPGPIEKMVCFAEDRSRNGVLMDELRVMMQAGSVSAYLTFTSAVKPIVQFVRIYGTKGIAEVDFGNHGFSYIKSTSLPGPIARVKSGFDLGKQFARGGIRHAWDMLKGKDRFFAGMGGLFADLYRRIQEGDETPPIPYEQVLRVSAIMDEIGRQCQEIEGESKKGGTC